MADGAGGRRGGRAGRGGARDRGRGASTGTPAAGANPARLASAQSNRYAYWRVALDAFAAHPLKGVGSGGFRVEWRRERTVADPARDAHSLYLETAAELGLVGLLLLGVAIAAVVVSAAQARRRDAAASAGLIAALALWAVHAGIDWDWEMPALTLVALALAAALSFSTGTGGLSRSACALARAARAGSTVRAVARELHPRLVVRRLAGDDGAQARDRLGGLLRERVELGEVDLRRRRARVGGGVARAAGRRARRAAAACGRPSP